MSYVTCCCSDPDCIANGCKLARQAQRPLHHPPQSPSIYAPLLPKGCICPPTSEKTCQAKDCPRKDRP